MAVVESPRPTIGIRYPEFNARRQISRGGSEITEEVEVEARTTPSPAVGDNVLFVALGKDVKESEPVLMWALHNSSGRRICILHVHQPAQKIPIMGTKISIERLEESQVKAYHEDERKQMLKILDNYIQTCKRAGVRAEKLYVEMDCIEKGIVKLISEHGIKWLVIGTSSYSRRTREPKSKKAIHVRAEAPSFCHISFICKGVHIYTRGSNSVGGNIEVDLPTPQANSSHGIRLSLSSRSVNEGQMTQTNSRVPAQDHRRIRSDNHVVQLFDEVSTPSNLGAEENIDREWLSRRSTSSTSYLSTGSHGEITLGLAQSPGGIESEIQHEFPMSQQNESNHPSHSSVASSVIEENMNDQLYDRLAQFVAEAENSHREAYEESTRRIKAEKDVINVIRRVKASEIMYAEELRRRKENEEALARSSEEFERIKWQLCEITEELRVAQEYKSLMERQISDSDKRVEDLEQKMFSAVELLKKYKNERGELQAERDNALRLAEELRRKQADEASSSSVSQFFSEFSFLEIDEATRNFSKHLKIGEGGYGSIFKGYLRYTQVAIKTLHPNSTQGPSEFQQEVNILSKLRHPNLVTLIGACPEAWALIYEYLPNGSLEDRLNCKDNTPPLSWKTRIRISAELCSALIFLHSCRPQGIVHGDLKPANILLDSNFTSKLGDFGICRVLSQDEFSENNTTQCCRTEPKGTLVYMDPEFLSTGELTSKSDVFSFGIILLRLLTGGPALGITKEVQYAIDKGNLKALLDPTAGDWPFVQAKQLAHLALRCSDVNRKNRPDLASEVWKVLESMRASCGVSSLRFGSGEHCQVPAYFVCPIFQEIMQDPVVAADGFTYEAEAMKGWLDSGQDTSPMTNLQLPHSNLIPNHALRSAIQEWLQQHP